MNEILNKYIRFILGGCICAAGAVAFFFSNDMPSNPSQQFLGLVIMIWGFLEAFKQYHKFGPIGRKILWIHQLLGLLCYILVFYHREWWKHQHEKYVFLLSAAGLFVILDGITEFLIGDNKEEEGEGDEEEFEE
jgi:uncharacterized membrane protein HdeD (DUF308 family)